MDLLQLHKISQLKQSIVEEKTTCSGKSQLAVYSGLHLSIVLRFT